MARGSQRNRFTIFDMMEAKGLFSSNPANADSVDPTEGTSLYSGPVAFPRMFYHPEAETRVINPGEVVRDGQGNPILDREGREQIRGVQTEIIWQLAHDAEGEARLRASGWHDHPAKALAASGQEAPPISSGQRVEEMEREVLRLQAELAAARQRPAPAVTTKRAAETPTATA